MARINEDAFGALGGGFDNTLSAASYNMQGQGPGYVYQVLPMTNTLQQPGNELSHEYYIHPGCSVRGHGYNNRDKIYSGKVNRIVRDGDGAVVCLYIQTFKTNRIVSICVDDELTLILPETPEPMAPMKIEVSNNLKLN